MASSKEVPFLELRREAQEAKEAQGAPRRLEDATIGRLTVRLYPDSVAVLRHFLSESTSSLCYRVSHDDFTTSFDSTIVSVSLPFLFYF